MSSWVLIIYLGWVQGYIKTEYPSEDACMEAAKKWRELNMASSATATCTKVGGK